MTSQHDLPHSISPRDPYRGAILVLLVLAGLGAATFFAGGLWLLDPVLLDAGLFLLLSAGVLVGVAAAQRLRSKPVAIAPEPARETDQASKQEEKRESGTAPPDAAPAPAAARVAAIGRRIRDLGPLGKIRIVTGVTGIYVILKLLLRGTLTAPLAPLEASVAAGFCLVAVGLAATAARYFAGLDPGQLPEAPGLTRGARVVAWVLLLTAVSAGFAGFGIPTGVLTVHFILLALAAAITVDLLRVPRRRVEAAASFPLRLSVVSIFGGRANFVASALDSVERQLGIDLRSTWALALVRRSLEPIAIALFLLGWLSTSLTVVGLGEQGLVERLGVPLPGAPLTPGLHLHWPWPIDNVFRVATQRVQALTVGHEGEEAGGREDVLWAREHAANEYTLLLGNGRDLITIDAAVQFRITDARAWLYHCQNPADALRAIAYRAVMRSTVNRTLSEALSENVVTLTAGMRDMVRQDAEALGLGVEPMAFTVGGMHPPVMVASDYQAVVSADLRRTTAIINAQVQRNRIVPAAEASVVMGANAARAAGAEALARAAGEAWSFRTLESQYRVAPGDYLFRRRLETLESVLGGRRFTVVDARIQRDGGELWLMP